MKSHDTNEIAPATISMAELRAKIELLSESHLAVVIEGLWKMNPSVDFCAYGLATEVIRFFMGNDWTNANVFGHLTGAPRLTEAARNYLKWDASDEECRFRHMERVTKLAQSLYALQEIPGIKQRIVLLQTDDVEAALGELECANLFSHPNYHFRFVAPTGKKGLDYEGELETSQGKTICCEIKTKKESTQIGASTIRSTLDKARKQLPSDKPGVVFLRLPDHWIVPETYGTVINCIDGVLRQSRRLVAVIIYYAEWIKYGAAGRAVVYKTKLFYNDTSPMLLGDIKETLERCNEIRNQNHFRFSDFVIGFWTATTSITTQDADWLIADAGIAQPPAGQEHSSQ